MSSDVNVGALLDVCMAHLDLDSFAYPLLFGWQGFNRMDGIQIESVSYFGTNLLRDMHPMRSMLQ